MDNTQIVGEKIKSIRETKQISVSELAERTGLAEEQIKTAFDQAEKEVTDLHSRISQGIREAKKNGVKIGIPKGTSLTTKKSLSCKSIILKHSKDFGGSLEDPEVIKLCGCSRNSYYKYKKEIKAGEEIL